MRTEEMLNNFPGEISLEQESLVTCIEACFECAQTCTACADGCLSEEGVEHRRRCIRLCLDCADICTTTARLLSRQTEPDLDLLRAQLTACLQACQVCGSECESHDDEHCGVCAEACRRCEEACDHLLNSFVW